LDPRLVVSYLKELCEHLDEGGDGGVDSVRQHPSITVPAAITYALGSGGGFEPDDEEPELLGNDPNDYQSDHWFGNDNTVSVTDRDDEYENDPDRLIEDDDGVDDPACLAGVRYFAPLSTFGGSNCLDKDLWIDYDTQDQRMDFPRNLVAGDEATTPGSEFNGDVASSRKGWLDHDDQDDRGFPGLVVDDATPFW